MQMKHIYGINVQNERTKGIVHMIKNFRLIYMSVPLIGGLGCCGGNTGERGGEGGRDWI